MPTVELVKELTGMSSASTSLVQFYIDWAEDFIRNYCRLQTVPVELYSTWTQIACKAVKANIGADGTGAAGSGSTDAYVQTITDGSQSIRWHKPEGGAQATDKVEFIGDEDFIKVFGPTLDRFRKMAVIGGRDGRRLGSRRV